MNGDFFPKMNAINECGELYPKEHLPGRGEMDKKVMCMQKSFQEDKTYTKSFMREVSNAKERVGKWRNMQKTALMRKNTRGKCLNGGKMFATKAFHGRKVSMKKNLYEEERCVGKNVMAGLQLVNGRFRTQNPK